MNTVIATATSATPASGAAVLEVGASYAEITDEQRNQAQAPPVTPPNPTAIADQIRRELAVIEMRRSRLLTD